MATDQRTVAILDILGFRDKVKNTPLRDLASEYERLIDNARAFNFPISAFGAEKLTHVDKSFSEPLCKTYVFSDTLILVSLDSDIISALKLLTYAWKLTQTMIANRVPVRGGIAFGEYYENTSKSIYIGKALTAAAELEKKQDWIGVAIDDTVRQAFPVMFTLIDAAPNVLNDLFPKYQVPMKGGPAEELYTLNWRWNLVVADGTRALFEISGEEHVQRKVGNTLEYAAHIVSGGRVYPGESVTLPVALRTMWVGKSRPPFKHGDEL